MVLELRIAITIALLVFFAIVFYLLKKRKLTLKYTLLWLLAGIVMAIVAAFPEAFEKITLALGVVDMYNGLFAILIFALMIILISITVIVSQLNDNLRALTQQCAMYEKRIRELEDDKR